MSTALAPVEEQSSPATISPNEWRMMREQANDLVQTGFLPSAVKKAEQALAIILTGRELGFQTMQSFRMLHIIDGKVTLSADAMAGLCNAFCHRSGGGYVRVIEQTSKIATVEFLRAEWPSPSRVSFTIEEATAAALTGKDNWKKYPADMLKARALARACRSGFPDVVSGLYDPDELGNVEPAHVITAPRFQLVDDADGAGETPKDGITSNTMKAIHAAYRERGVEEHAFISAEAQTLYDVDSMTKLTEAQGQDFLEKIKALPVLDSEGIDEAERALIHFRERIEAAASERDWRDLIGDAGEDQSRWLLLAKNAPDKRVFNFLKIAAVKAKVMTDDLSIAFGRRDQELGPAGN